MSNCQRCQSERVCDVMGKCSDCFSAQVGNNDGHDGYVPNGLGIGGGDEMVFSFCLNCGQIQDIFPKPIHHIETPEHAAEVAARRERRRR